MRKVSFVVVLALFGGLLFLAGPIREAGAVVPGSAAQGTIPPMASMNIDFVGQLGGTASAIAADNSYVYAGFGMEFAVLALSPSLHRVGYTLLPNTVQKIVLDGTYAYVLADGALNIVDIADPQRPTPVIDEYPRMATDSAALTSGDLAVRDRRAYLRSGADLYIIDVQDPRHPVTLYETHNVSLGESLIDAQGNFMYRTFGCRELEAWDISQPSSPTVVAHLPQEEGHRYGCYVSGFVVEGDYAYISYAGAYNSEPSLAIVRIADPHSPSVASKSPLPISAGKLVIDGNRAYTMGEYGLGAILDIADPTSPQVLSELDIHGRSSSVAVQNGRVYVSTTPRSDHDSDMANGVQALDVITPTLPVVVDSYFAPAGGRFLAARDAFAYLIDGNQTLWVIDTSNPASPRTRSHLSLKQSTDGPVGVTVGEKSAVTSNYLYLSAKSSSTPKEPAEDLRIVSIADPAHPQVIARLPIAFHGLDVDNGFLYLATCSGILIYDQDNPAQPSLKGRFQTIGCARDIDVVPPYAYIYDDIGLVWVLDITNPAQPASIGSVSMFLGDAVSTLHVDQDRLYIQERWSTVHVLDITDPAQPKPVGAVAVNRIPVTTDGNYIYDVDGGRLQLIDATDPASPVSLGYFAYPRVHIYDGTVAVVDGLVHSSFSSNAGGGGLVLLRRSKTLLRTRSYLPLVVTGGG